MTPVTRGLLLR